MSWLVKFFNETELGAKILNWITWVVSKINWKQRHAITADEKRVIQSMLEKDYYVILTRHGNHLSTVAINIAHKALTGRKGYYGHVLMNLEDEVNDPNDFRLVEAIGSGSQFSSFDDVFGDADSVALLKPKTLSMDDWRLIMDRAPTLTGRPYDSVYDMYNDSKLSCVELVRNALQADPDYDVCFDQLDGMLAQYKRLDPQMYYECTEDFEVVFETRHGWGS